VVNKGQSILSKSPTLWADGLSAFVPSKVDVNDETRRITAADAGTNC